MLARIIAIAAFAIFSTVASAQTNMSEPSPERGLTHAEKIMPGMVKYNHDLIAEEKYYCKDQACHSAFEKARIASIEVVHAALAQDLAEIDRDQRRTIVANAVWVIAKKKSDAAFKATRRFVTTTGSK